MTPGGDPDVDVVHHHPRSWPACIRARAHQPATTCPMSDFDAPLGIGSGAGVIFGATGGVMEAALRTAYYARHRQDPATRLQFDAVRGTSTAWKEAIVRPGRHPGAAWPWPAAWAMPGSSSTPIRRAARSTTIFVEIMACPGGCAGGGGQPIHDGEELAGARGDVLWGLDRRAKLRNSYENPSIAAIYADYLGEPLSERAKELLHTDHFAWSMR